MPTSLHAEYLERYFPDHSQAERQESLDRVLQTARLLPSEAVGEMDPASRQDQPLGTVVRQTVSRACGESREAYLFANSRRLTHGFAGENDLVTVLDLIWKYRRTHGVGGDRVVFPLNGAGESRNQSKTQAIVKIIDTYFTQVELHQQDTSIKKLVLSIHPNAVRNGEIGLEAIHRYLRARIGVHLE